MTKKTFLKNCRRGLAHKKNLGRDDPNIETKHISAKCLHNYDKHWHYPNANLRLMLKH
jgi:hypothetical protein